MGSRKIRVAALVPARGGSKGIPMKNIRPLCGKPLIYWVCKAAQDTPAIDEVYVSTDSEKIAGTALSMGLDKVKVIERDPGTATDSASTESVMFDFAERVDFDYIALLQATSPLLTAKDLIKGCEAVFNGGFDSVLSVVRQTRFHWQKQADGAAVPENYTPRNRPRRQEFAGYFVENGAFYITSRERLLGDKCRIGGRIGMTEMPEDTYYELDDLTDWTIVEALLRHRLGKRPLPIDDRARRIRLAVSDVDGCLTDSGMYYGEAGDELKKFNTRDGFGFERLRNAGILGGLITRENTALVQRRAAKLRLDEVHQGAADKVRVMEEILAKHNLQWEEAAYLGDDIMDLELLRRVGLSACPADALEPVRSAVDLVLSARGGEGALRELAEIILAARAAE